MVELLTENCLRPTVDVSQVGLNTVLPCRGPLPLQRGP